MDIAKLRSVLVAESIDGARLSNCLGHVMFGLKFPDRAATGLNPKWMMMTNALMSMRRSWVKMGEGKLGTSTSRTRDWRTGK
jgi:hypothetical protein